MATFNVNASLSDNTAVASMAVTMTDTNFSAFCTAWGTQFPEATTPQHILQAWLSLVINEGLLFVKNYQSTQAAQAASSAVQLIEVTITGS